jgi:hypothetical protein
MGLNSAGLTDAIAAAFKEEWIAAKKVDLPEAGNEDRRLMFAAIARGILEYLHTHQKELFNTITVEEQPDQIVTHKVKDVDLNITT